jgi:hypothetical protein
MPHAGKAYAAVLALGILATDSEDSNDTSTEEHAVSESAMMLLKQIRLPMYGWMLLLQEQDGSYPSESVLYETYPVCNLRIDRVRTMLRHWQTHPIIPDLL